MGTNKKVLLQGIQFLAGALPALFAGPVVINSALKNKESLLFPYVFGLGVLICGLAVFLIFKGINTIIKSLFDSDKQ